MSFQLGNFVVTYTGDTSDLDDSMNRTEARSKGWADRMQQHTNVRPNTNGFAEAGRTIAAWGDGVRGTFRRILELATGNALGSAITNLVNRAVMMGKNAIIGVNENLETTTQQFSIMMGDADRAKEHVRGLFAFAKTSPFESGPVIQASKMLQTFGGDALNTKETLTLMGDAAAATSADIGELGTWFGRMYTAIKNGQPAGEATARLQELAIISGDTRLKLEQMQAAGKKGPEVWKFFTESLQQFNGAMVAQAGTWKGLTSSLADAINLNAADVFAPVFEFSKRWVGLLVTFLSSDTFSGFVERASAAMEKFMNVIGTVAEAILPVFGVVWGVIEPIIAQAEEWGRGFTKAFADGAAGGMSFLMDALSSIGGFLTDWLEPHSPPKLLPDLTIWGKGAIKAYADGWKDAKAFKIFDQIAGNIEAVLKNMFTGGKKNATTEVNLVKQMGNVRGALAQVITAFEAYGRSAPETTTALEAMRVAAGPAGDQMVDLANNLLTAEAANRRLADAQKELNSVTEEYDAILNPLNVQMTGIQRKMQTLRDNKTIAEIKAKLANPPSTATAEDRGLLQLQLQEAQLRQNIGTQEAAKQAAQRAAQEKIKAAQKEAEAASQAVERDQARLKLQQEELSLHERMTAAIERQAKEVGAAADSVKKDTKSVIDAAKKAAEELQAKYDAMVAKFQANAQAARDTVTGTFTNAGQTITSTLTRVTAAFTPLGAVLQGLTLAPFVGWVSQSILALRPLTMGITALRGSWLGIGSVVASINGGAAQLATSFGAIFSAVRNIVTAGNPLRLIPAAIGSIPAAIGGVFRALTGGLKSLVSLESILKGLRSLFSGGSSLFSLVTSGGAGLLRVGANIIGLASPLNIILTLVNAFAEAWTRNTQDIQGKTEAMFSGVMPLLNDMGNLIKRVIEPFQRQDKEGDPVTPLKDKIKEAWAALTSGFPQLLPSLQSAGTSVLTWLQQLVPIIGETLRTQFQQLLNWIGQAAPPIVAKLSAWTKAFIDWIAPMIPPMLKALGAWVGAIIDDLAGRLPGIVAQLTAWGQQFIAWVTPMIPPLLKQLGELLSALFAWVAERAPKVLAQLGEWGTQLIGWVVPMIPPLIDKLGVLFGDFLAWIVAKAPALLEKLGEWAKQFGTWAKERAGPALQDALGTMFTGMWARLKELWTKAFSEGSLGTALVDGIKNGVINGWNSFATWFQNQLNALLPEWLGGGKPAIPVPSPQPPPSVQPPPTAPTAPPPTSDRAERSSPDGSTPEKKKPLFQVPVTPRAKGGKTNLGELYLVGEKGPELFSPHANGTVIPNDVLRQLTERSPQPMAMNNAPSRIAPTHTTTTIAPVVNISIPVTVQSISNQSMVDTLVAHVEARVSKTVADTLATIIRGGVA